MTETRRPPAAFRLEPAPEPAKPRPARAPRALAAPSIEFAPQEPVSEPLVPVEPRRRRGWRWGLVLLSSLLALVSLMAGLAVTRLIEDLFARSAAFGWIGLGVAGLAVLAACALILSEVWSLLRLPGLTASRPMRHSPPASTTGRRASARSPGSRRSMPRGRTWPGASSPSTSTAAR